jgi:hypothetical protein
VNMSTPLPSAKVTAGTLAGAATTLLLFLVNHYLLRADPIPAEAGALAVWVVGNSVAYFVRPSRVDVAVAPPKPPAGVL